MLHLSNRAVVLASVDRPRADVVLEHWLENGRGTAHVLSPLQVAQTERIFAPTPPGARVLVNPPLEGHVDEKVERAFGQSAFGAKERYYLAADARSVRLWTDEAASDDDVLKGYVHAALVRRAMIEGVAPDDAVAKAHKIVVSEFEGLREKMERSGWDTRLVSLASMDHAVRVESRDEHK